MPPFQITTDRLTIRPLAPRDIPTFVAYRNVEAVARFQDWPLPYTEAMAVDLVGDVGRQGGPTPGEWVQLALEHDGDLVGDVAVWLDDQSQLASIGYTVAPEHQGHHYAVEAADAVVAWLFTTARVHRIAATIDPRNMASAAVLERCGFEFVGTVPASAYVRGEWADDTRFSLLANDWRAWRERATGSPTSIEFIEVTPDNLRDVCAIEVAHSQRRFVSTVTQSIADAAHPPIHEGVQARPWYRAIVADGGLAGFAMVAMPTETQPVPILWRMLVGTWFQRRGIARRAIVLLAEMLQDQGCDRLDVSFVDEPGGPEEFYRMLGFERTGLIEDGEVWARATLDQIRHRAT
jgi:RimJ/RimL family protein N-acetyltransferase